MHGGLIRGMARYPGVWAAGNSVAPGLANTARTGLERGDIVSGSETGLSLTTITETTVEAPKVGPAKRQRQPMLMSAAAGRSVGSGRYLHLKLLAPILVFEGLFVVWPIIKGCFLALQQTNYGKTSLRWPGKFPPTVARPVLLGGDQNNPRVHAFHGGPLAVSSDWPLP